MRILMMMAAGAALVAGCDDGAGDGGEASVAAALNANPDIRQAQRVATAHLPDSRADFRNLRIVPVTAHQTGIIGVGPTLVCGEINARNAQGEPVGFIRFYADPSVEERQQELTGLGRVGFDPVIDDAAGGMYAIMHRDRPSDLMLDADRQTFDWLYNEACENGEASDGAE
ncbi:MAG: hypothetical protein ACK4FB_10630 [Brevundimonas sp.]|uniref:hypothetical protein n=1 Tax=Brevundimonas sp. TaxID=1871086 RepID=UPI00391B9541